MKKYLIPHTLKIQYLLFQWIPLTFMLFAGKRNRKSSLEITLNKLTHEKSVRSRVHGIESEQVLHRTNRFTNIKFVQLQLDAFGVVESKPAHLPRRTWCNFAVSKRISVKYNIKFSPTLCGAHLTCSVTLYQHHFALRFDFESGERESVLAMAKSHSWKMKCRLLGKETQFSSVI